MNKFTLTKFGKSECKRKDIKQTYTNFASFFNDFENFTENKKGFKTSEIQDKWTNKYHIFDSRFKSEENINREISYLKQFGIGEIILKDGRYFIKASNLSKNWSNEKFDNVFFGLSSEDFAFFQLILKMKYVDNYEKRSSFFKIIKFVIENEKITPEAIMSEGEKEFIKKIISEKNILEIKKILFFKSGSPKDDSSKSINLIMDSFLELWANEDNDFSALLNNIENFLKIKDIPKALSVLVFGLDKTMTHKKYYNFLKKNKNYLIDLIKEGLLNFEERLIKRRIYGSWSDYRNLIISHLNSLDNIFLISSIDNGKNIEIKIDKKYRKLIEDIINSGEKKIIDLDNNYFYSPDEICRHFNLENENIKQDVQMLINNYYSKDMIINYLSEIKLIYSGKSKGNELKTKWKKIIDNHPHVKGKINPPTYFEFIIGMAFFSRFYNNFSFDRENLSKVIRAKLDSNLCPISFATGGKADIQIISNDRLLNVEPSIQMERQSRMELEPSRDHLISDFEKNDFLLKGKSIITFPKITGYMKADVIGFNQLEKDKYKIIIFGIDDVISMVKGEENFESFFDLL